MHNDKRILMVVENLSVPADPRVWREAQTLNSAGYHVSIICPLGEKRDCEPYTCIDDIHIYRYRPVTNARGSIGYIKEYLVAMVKTFGLSFKVWREQDFAVIHAANPPDTFFIIGLFYRLFGKKYIFDQHDLAPEMLRVKFKKRWHFLFHILCFMERCSYQLADIVITTNESQKRNAIQRGRCQPEKIVVVRNGPDLAAICPQSPDPSLKIGKRHLLAYVGVMGSQDGIEYALEAMHILVHQHGRRDVGLVLIGDGDERECLERLTYTLQLEEYVHFTGWLSQSELQRYLRVADIGLSPDPSNELNDHSTMIKTMEYMAMSKPVVAFDLPETHYSAQDAALYATPNNVTEFAKHVETLLEDESLRYQMGQRGRKRVEEQLCWARSSEVLRGAYQRLFPQNEPQTAVKYGESATKRDRLPASVGD